MLIFWRGFSWSELSFTSDSTGVFEPSPLCHHFYQPPLRRTFWRIILSCRVCPKYFRMGHPTDASSKPHSSFNNHPKLSSDMVKCPLAQWNLNLRPNAWWLRLIKITEIKCINIMHLNLLKLSSSAIHKKMSFMKMVPGVTSLGPLL